MVIERPTIWLYLRAAKDFVYPLAASGLLAILLASTAGQCCAGEPPSAELEFYEKKIRPLLVEHCYECHGGGKSLEANLRLNSPDGWLAGGDTGPAVVPGKPDKSLLIEAIRYGGDVEMPPKGKLADEKIKLFEEWVARGAAAPKGSGPSVARERTIDLEAGRQFWAYRPVEEPSIPTPANASWSSHPIDRFLLARLEAADIAPNEEADRPTLVRRLYFDLLGLPPTPEEIDEFLKDDSEQAYERLVDRLLASSHFGERWGRHWLDVVRFAESLTLRGFILHEAWRYRDYVIDAFNEDRPYDQFLREQVAGDLLPAESLADKQRQLIATTFLALGNTNLEEQDKRQLDMDVIDEQLDTIGKAMLAQTIGCARCHDHKFDPIPTRDYYAMAGILRNMRTLEHANVSKWIEAPLPVSAAEEESFAKTEALVASIEKRIRELRTLIAEASDSKDGNRGPVVLALQDLPGIVVDDSQAKKVGEWRDSQFTKRYIGSGYAHDDNNGKGEKTLTFVPALPRSGKYEVRLAYSHYGSRATNVPVTVFSADGERTIEIDQRQRPPIDGRFVWLGEYYFEQTGQSFVLVSNEGTTGHITADAVQFLPVDKSEALSTNAADSSQAHTTELSAKQTELSKLEVELRELRRSAPKRPVTMTVVEGKEFTDSPIHRRGSVHTLGEVVPRGFLQVASANPGPSIAPGQSGRRQLADWLAAKSNPLPARVYTNRIWHWLFGQGLVRTTDNFGATGEAPSHPELLDYLANKFVDEGWSIKKLIRHIVLSKAYRLSSAENAMNLERDPENRLVWRMNRKRLEAECIRDAMLLVSGQLDRTAKGSTIKPGTTADYGYQHSGNRRSVYLPVLRNSLPELFEAFDFADPSLVVGERNTSTVATQALYLLNDPFVVEQARAAAKRALAEPVGADDERLERAFRRALGRAPTADEARIACNMIIASGDSKADRVDAWTELFHALFATVDFRYRD